MFKRARPDVFITDMVCLAEWLISAKYRENRRRKWRQLIPPSRWFAGPRRRAILSGYARRKASRSPSELRWQVALDLAKPHLLAPPRP